MEYMKTSISAHMLGDKNRLSRPSIDMNNIWEPVMQCAREKQQNEQIIIWERVKKKDNETLDL